MTLAEAKQLCTLLYYTATGTHNVDDRQWAVLIDIMNKKYWNEISRAIGSIYAMDTPDLFTDGYGQLDYSGSSVVGNDLNQRAVKDISTASGWTLTNVTINHNKSIGPDGTLSAIEMAATAATGAHSIAISSLEPGYQQGQGVVTIYAKAGTARYLYISAPNGGSNVANYDLLTGTLSTVAAGVTASISPVPQPGFGAYVTPVTGGATNISSTGWYKLTYKPLATEALTDLVVGSALVPGVYSYTSSGADVYLYSPRRSYSDDMIDPAGVHMPLAVELKFFGRYVKLDYEIPQDRYIYNIAFGQVQVLIPSAWTVLGEKITLLPRVSGAQTIRVSYIPRLVDLTNDDQQLLMGRLPTYHPLIAYEVVMSMLPSGTERANVVAPLGELRAQLKNYLQSRQRQDGRKIRFVPYE